MKITIVYDNEIRRRGLKADWGFSCLIEIPNVPPILFDTGTLGSILLHNMSELGLDPRSIGMVVISHPHGDHTGGLHDVLEANRDIELYIPKSCEKWISAKNVNVVNKEPSEIRPNIFSTGELGIEQSLAINADKGVLVVVGCSHPGVGRILEAASRFGRVYGIVGGLHGFSDFKRLTSLSLICPCHCTQYKSEIKRLFRNNTYLDCGVGAVIEL